MDAAGLDNIESIRDRLRDFKAREVMSKSVTQPPATQPLLHYPGVLLTEVYVPEKRKLDAVDEQIQAYLARPVSIGPISEMFATFTQVIKDMKPLLYDFEDDIERNKLGITMIRADAKDITQLCRDVSMISSEFSRRGAAAVFTLAYNATAPGSDHQEPLFPNVITLENLQDKTYEEFFDRILSAGNVTGLSTDSILSENL